MGAALPVSAAQAQAATLYVNNDPAAHCSNSGSGTQAQPYCTVQAAADAAQPGTTVQIAEGDYPEQVTVTHSGSPGNPVTFRGVPLGAAPEAVVGLDWGAAAAQTLPHGFVLANVHDITVSGLQFGTPQEAVLVTDADRIVLDGNTFLGSGQQSYHSGVVSYPNPAPAVRLTGKTTGTTISRNRIGGSGTAGVVVDPGVAGTVVTTNAFTANNGDGVLVTDAPGTVVVGNSLAENCRTAVTLAGNSAGSTLENNITMWNHKVSCPGQTGGPEVVVSAGSTTGTKADYNVVKPRTGVAYGWAAAGYDTPSAFTKATGQGAHDLQENSFNLDGSSNEELQPSWQSLSVDSADADAPGMLAVDINGKARIDAPSIANTGTGVGYHDRGAAEVQVPFFVRLEQYFGTLIPSHHPLDAAWTGMIMSPWSPATGTVDFGDHTSVEVTAESFPLVHSYPGPGTYTVTLTASNGLGLTRSTSHPVTIAPVGPLTDLSVSASQKSGDPNPHAWVYVSANSPWPIARTTLDFGDGSPVLVTDGEAWEVPHDYPRPGLYTLSATIVDDHGRSVSRSEVQQIAGADVGHYTGTPVAGRWTGTRTSYVGLFRDGQWALSTANQDGPPTVQARFGQPGDVPTVADWDGVGHDQLGIYRAGVFGVRHDDGTATAIPFGQPGDIPVPGYWDHNGHAQLAIYRSSIRTFAVRHDDGSVSTATFGDLGDIPLVGDWDGVGHTQMGIFRPGRGRVTNVFALRHDNGSVTAATFGDPGDIPLVGDWKGQGRTSYGIHRQGDGYFGLSNAYVKAADTAFQITLR